MNTVACHCLVYISDNLLFAEAEAVDLAFQSVVALLADENLPRLRRLADYLRLGQSLAD